MVLYSLFLGCFWGLPEKYFSSVCKKVFSGREKTVVRIDGLFDWIICMNL